MKFNERYNFGNPSRGMDVNYINKGMVVARKVIVQPMIAAALTTEFSNV
jgi:hypothetical protein